MATVVKDFKIKSGLIVEGASASVNGFSVLTKATADQNYIIGLIGGSATAAATPDTVVLRDANGDFAAKEIAVASLVLNGDDLSTTLTGIDSDAQGYATAAQSAAESFATSADTVLYGTVTGDIATAKSEAISDAAADATTKANAALTSAQSYADQAELDAIASSKTYTDGRETAITTAYQSYADQAEADAISSSNTYTDGRETAITTAYQSYANQAELDAVSTANAYTDGEISNIGQLSNDYVDLLVGDATVDGTPGNTVTDRIDTAVAALVDGAPELLDTLNELAAAIADDENFATTMASDIATGVTTAKAYTDTREGLITTAYQTYADTAESDAVSAAALDATTKANAALASAQSYADTAEADAISTSNTYTDGRETAITTAYQLYADQAETDAKSYADGLAANYDAAGDADQALVDAKAYTDTEISTVTGLVDNLTTDDVAEGTSLYFTDTRAKVSASSLLTGATLANITITGDENGLTITAENGVADSDTDDLSEGTGNLYFTDERAVTALEAVVPNFTEVDINSVVSHVAGTVEVPVAGIANAYVFDSATYTSAEFLVKVAAGVHTEVSKVLVTVDTSGNIALTEYGIIGTNGTLGAVTAALNGTDIELQVTTVNNNSTVTVAGTLLV